MERLVEAAEPKDEEVCIGRRAAARVRLQVNASLQSVTREIRVIVRNLSCTGAMLEGRDLPLPGRTVVLRHGSSEVMAEVIWSENDRCGIEFLDPIPHEEVVKARGALEPAPIEAVPYYWRSALQSALKEEKLSVEEWQTTRAWALRARH